MVSELSLKCYEKDGYICQNCNCDLSQSNNRPECHHITHVRDGGTDEMHNLKTLCKDCHKKEHVNREWSRGSKYVTGSYYIPMRTNKTGWCIHIPTLKQIANLYKCTVKDDGSLLYVPVKS